MRRDRDRDILANTVRVQITEYPGTPAWTPTDTRDLLVAGVQAGLDTCDLVVAGVRISISPKYLYLYLELSGSTF